MELNSVYINTASISSKDLTNVNTRSANRWHATINRLVNLRDHYAATPYTNFLHAPCTWIQIPARVALQTTICVISSLWTFAIGTIALDSKYHRSDLHSWMVIGGFATVGVVAMGLSSWAAYRSVHFPETCAEQEMNKLFWDIRDSFDRYAPKAYKPSSQLQGAVNEAIEKAHKTCLTKIKAAANTKDLAIYRDKINKAIIEMRSNAIESVIERIKSEGVEQV